MNKIHKIWDFLNEKKTAIGSGFLIAGHVFGKFPQTAFAGSIFEEIGMYIAGIGLTHKVVKATKTDKT